MVSNNQARKKLRRTKNKEKFCCPIFKVKAIRCLLWRSNIPPLIEFKPFKWSRCRLWKGGGCGTELLRAWGCAGEGVVEGRGLWEEGFGESTRLWTGGDRGGEGMWRGGVVEGRALWMGEG